MEGLRSTPADFIHGNNNRNVPTSLEFSKDLNYPGLSSPEGPRDATASCKPKS